MLPPLRYTWKGALSDVSFLCTSTVKPGGASDPLDDRPMRRSYVVRYSTRPSNNRRAVRYTAAYSATGSAPPLPAVTLASTTIRPDGCPIRIDVASAASPSAIALGIEPLSRVATDRQRAPVSGVARCGWPFEITR